MSIRKVARMGHPVLRQVARELKPEEIRSPWMKQLLQDMIDTMGEYSGIGLAAPQIHESVSVAVIGFEESERYPGTGRVSLNVYINPKITVLDKTEQAFWEGCLSVPELRGLVHRPRKIRVDYLDQDAKPQAIEAEGFLATVFQHELDHLAGKLFVDRIKDTSKLAFLEEYQRYHIPAEDSEEGELDD
jgi:peptide deformylase